MSSSAIINVLSPFVFCFFAPTKHFPGSLEICSGVFLIAKQDLNAFIIAEEDIESITSVCNAFDTSHKYIRIQTFDCVLEAIVGFTKNVQPSLQILFGMVVLDIPYRKVFFPST